MPCLGGLGALRRPVAPKLRAKADPAAFSGGTQSGHPRSSSHLLVHAFAFRPLAARAGPAQRAQPYLAVQGEGIRRNVA